MLGIRKQKGKGRGEEGRAGKGKGGGEEGRGGKGSFPKIYIFGHHQSLTTPIIIS